MAIGFDNQDELNPEALAKRIKALEAKLKADVPFDRLPKSELLRYMANSLELTNDALGAGQVGTSTLADRSVRAPKMGVGGMIEAAGTIGRGTGFTVVRNGAGDYTVTYDIPFYAVPITLAFSGTTGGAIGVKGSGATTPTVSLYRFVTFTTTTGVNADGQFSFLSFLP